MPDPRPSSSADTLWGRKTHTHPHPQRFASLKTDDIVQNKEKTSDNGSLHEKIAKNPFDF